MTFDHVHALPPGTRFEEYRLDMVLGAGGFGITYRAYDGNLDKYVAIKEYLPSEFAARTEASTVVPHSSTDAQDYHWGLSRFLDEARTLARFEHPNLNKVYRFFEANGTAYMVLEYIHGETLAGRLGRERRLPEEVLIRLLEELLSGLAVVHDAGYVHRDIKPGNLMLREEDGGAVLLDFGAARQAVGRRSQRLTTILTPGYAPIEQYDSKADDVGPWSDIYALGMVAYRCISGVGDGELPDAVTRAREQRKGSVDLEPAVEAGRGRYDPKLLAAIDWALYVNEDERPQGVDEWSAALAGGSVRKRKTKPVGKPAKRTAKPRAGDRSGMSWSGIALTVVIVVLLGASAWQGWRLYQGMPMVSLDDAVTMVKSLAGRLAETVSEETPASIEQDGVTEEAPQTADTMTDNAAAEPGQPAAEPEEAPPPVEEDEVTRLLVAAEADIAARRLTSPVGNNAWEKYQRVLGLSPAHPEAVAGMERVMKSYLELFGAALAQEEFDKAGSYLGRIRELHPDSPVLEDGERRIEAARQAQADRLAKIEAIPEYLNSVDAALKRGDLDTAASVLAEIRSLDPEVQGLTEGEQRLAEARQAEAARLAEVERQRQAALEKAKAAAGETLLIPGGTFQMGDLSGEGDEDEKPVHTVTVKPFKLGKYEVTFDQWDACVADGGCNGYRPDDAGWGKGNQPVIHVSWEDTQTFISWLNSKTGGGYRLPTEAEWEYAARAGSETKFSMGDDIGENLANCDNCGSRWDDKQTAPAGSFPVNNSWGLHDMHGNVWEWVEDCWHENYQGAPDDGSAWTTGSDCSRRVIRGGSWNDIPNYLRSAHRIWFTHSGRVSFIGFRLAQDN